MDPRERLRLEKERDQGQAFKRLSMHGDWEYFRKWVELAREGYDRKIHAQDSRADHVTLARALEGYDAIDNLLSNFDRAVSNIPKNQEKLDGPGTDSNNN